MLCSFKTVKVVPHYPSNPGPCVEEVYHRHMVSYLCPGNKALSCSSALCLCVPMRLSPRDNMQRKEWPIAFWDSCMINLQDVCDCFGDVVAVRVSEA